MRPLGIFDLGRVLAPLALVFALFAGCSGDAPEPVEDLQGADFKIVSEPPPDAGPGGCADGRPACDGVCCATDEVCHPVLGHSYCEAPLGPPR